MALTPCRGPGILVFGLELDPEAVGQRLHRGAEVQTLGLHHEVEGIAAGLTAEAVVVLLIRAHVEGATALVMERAQAEVAVDPGPAQLDPRSDQGQHVDRGQDVVTGVGGVAAHGAKATGTVSSS